MVFVTHDEHEAAVLAQRVIVLKKGTVALDRSVAGGIPRDFFSRPPVEDELVRALMGE